MVLLRKQDIDPRIFERLPAAALDVPKAWMQNLLLLTLIPLILTGFFALSMRDAAYDVPIFIGGGVLFFVLLGSGDKMIHRHRQHHSLLRPDGLRRLAKTCKSLTPVEREYCRTVATLAGSSALAETAARELLTDLNRLLAAHRKLMAQELPKKTRLAREEAVQKTFQGLRASLKRAGKLVSEPPQSPAVVAEEAVEETVSRVRLQARSLEQATEEVQSLRR